MTKEEVIGGIAKGVKKAADAVGRTLKKMARNDLTVSGKKNSFTLPLLAAAAVSLIGIEIALPAFIISLFCGVRYTFSGPDFGTGYAIGGGRLSPARAITAKDGSDTGFFGV